jgi:oligopeptide/dipeptide ABC transporter ATP-binding protein
MVLGGEVPSPIHPPKGCPFHPRCPIAESRCRYEPPNPREILPQHWVSCHLAK